jgi:hypothetical protein
MTISGIAPGRLSSYDADRLKQIIEDAPLDPARPSGEDLGDVNELIGFAATSGVSVDEIGRAYRAVCDAAATSGSTYLGPLPHEYAAVNTAAIVKEALTTGTPIENYTRVIRASEGSSIDVSRFARMHAADAEYAASLVHAFDKANLAMEANRFSDSFIHKLEAAHVDPKIVVREHTANLRNDERITLDRLGIEHGVHT